MSEASQRAREKGRVRRLLPWKRAVLQAIKARISDAHAHAGTAITDTLRQTPEGRDTAFKARASRSSQAAQSRLDELVDLLAGPSSRSLSGLIRDAREVFFRASFEEWLMAIPPDLLVRPDPVVTQAQIRAIRGAPIGGQDLRLLILPRIEAAKLDLLRSITSAGHRGQSQRSRDLILRTWQAQKEASLWNQAQILLSDSEVTADSFSLQCLIHPRHLPENESALEA